MPAGIKYYSITAASNNDVAPFGWKEGMAASDVNNTARQLYADLATWYASAVFTELNHTIAYVSAVSFTAAHPTTPTDLTSIYEIGRVLRFTDSSTLYGVVTASSFSTPTTTVTVALYSGSLSASLTAVAPSIITASNSPMPTTFTRKGADIASATTTNLAAASGVFVDVTGTTTITGLGTATAGTFRVVRFTGALTLTHNATSLILPGAVNYTTVNGDIAEFWSLGSGNWVCSRYIRGNGANTVINVKGADIASATTTDLSAATGDYVDVTGTTTITGLGTANAGIVRRVRFTGALILTHNATSLILPGATNITTVANDTAEFVSLSSGNWRCTKYQRSAGGGVQAGTKSADLASASTVDLGTATGDYVEISGTTTITSFGSTAGTGRHYFCRLLGDLTITYNATSLILPGSADIVGKAGDTLVMVHNGSGNWKCSFYFRKDGYALNGVVQRVSTLTGTLATGTTTIPEDNTIPQNTEGDQYMSLAITPKNTANILVIDVVFNGTNSASFSNVIAALFQDSTANALACAENTQNNGGGGGIIGCIAFRHVMTAGITSATTFKVRAGSNAAGTTSFNGSGGTQRFGGVLASSISITEYTA